MAISLIEETTLTLAEAARSLPPLRRGRPVHVSTLHRWAAPGVRGVRLETLKVGRTRVTSLEALQRFVERLTDADRPEAAGPSDRALAAEQELDRRGL